MKKGQITIFMILGIIILASVILIYLSKDKISEFSLDNDDSTGSKNDKAMVKNYVEKCMEDVGVLGLYLLANKGGQIYSYDNMLLTEYEEISYGVKYNGGAYSLPNALLSEYEDEYGSLYKEDVSVSQEFMIDEVNTFIENSIVLCMYKADFLNLELEFEEINAVTKFNRNDVSISLDFPITILSDKKNTRVNGYKIDLPFRMRKIIDTRNDIIEMILEDDLYLEELASMDMEIDILPFDGKNTVYSIYDEKSGINEAPFIFKFATNSKFNIYPKLEFIPDFVVDKGEMFTYITNVSDVENNEFTYTSTNPLIDINNKGVISFLPVNTGITNTTICVIDPMGGKDCKNVRFKVA